MHYTAIPYQGPCAWEEWKWSLDPEEGKGRESILWVPLWLPQNCIRSQRGLTTMIPSFGFLSSFIELYFTVFGMDRLTNTRPAIYYISYQMGLNAHVLQHVFLSGSSVELLQSSVHLRWLQILRRGRICHRWSHSFCKNKFIVVGIAVRKLG